MTPDEISTLSRLLDEALTLADDRLPAWLAAQQAQHGALLPALRGMLAARASGRADGFLAAGPQLAARPPPSAPAAQPGDAAGPYRLLRLVGQGGMASVWLAERSDGSVKRRVALKLPLLKLTPGTQLARFEHERDVLALLNHPQIARLYDAGVTLTGQPYIVMEPVDGQPITEACDAACMDVPARLQVFLQVLAAVAHAHKHLVVHRDIKPSNVFVDHDGNVKLLDFGIAKLLAAPSGAPHPGAALTADGACVMTPRHAAPEQIEGGPITTATDIYALGLLLCQLLCGALPHGDAQRSLAEAVHAALHTPPCAPSQASVDDRTAAQRGLPTAARLRARLAGDLDTIVLKALHKAPAGRYASVEAMADDIRSHLAHRPIAARPPSPWRRLGLFVRRHRHATAVAAVGGSVALALTALLGLEFRHTAEQASRANAVREFMLDMVESAEADEAAPGTEVTGRQMVEAGLRRAHARFRGQPQLLGEVLSELGRMFDRFGDDAHAAAALAEADTLLRANAPAGDPALNKNRVLLASAAYAANDLQRAGALAETALRACGGSGAECAKARAYAQALLSNLAAHQGRWAEALASMRASVADTERGFGALHAETAMAWHDLALTARDAGNLTEAEQALQRAVTVAAQAVLRVRDRTSLSRTQAVIALEMGHADSARALLQRLLAQTSDSGEKALQWRLLASAEVALDNGPAAVAAAEQALALADTSNAGPERWFAHQAHARAASLLGRHDDALAEMQAVQQGLAASGYAPGSAPQLRAQRFMAEMLARRGDWDAAWARSEAVVSALGARPGNNAIELGQALDLQGQIRQAQGHALDAAALHRRASDLLRPQLPPAHPLLARNRQLAEQARVALAAAAVP